VFIIAWNFELSTRDYFNPTALHICFKS